MTTKPRRSPTRPPGLAAPSPRLTPSLSNALTQPPSAATRFTTHEGKVVQLGKRLGRGGEGEVFEVMDDPTTAAKVLHAKANPRKAEKVKQMIARPPAGAYDTIEGYPVLTWPKAMLRPEAGRPGSLLRGGEFAGYTMTRIRPHDFVPFYQITTANRRAQLG